MKFQKVLLTGGSGNLGSAIIASQKFPSLIAPSEIEMDITTPGSIQAFLNKNKIDAVIHCAAIARMVECEKKKELAIKTNILGTGNLVNAVLREEAAGRDVRFVHISTDGVYEGTKGNYSEQDPTIPYNFYGWTKLGAEASVRLLNNHCIVRTRFFDPRRSRFKTYPTDLYTSKIQIGRFIEALEFLARSDFTGAINVGDERMSEYNRHFQYDEGIGKCTFSDVQKFSPVKMAQDASMDCSKWRALYEEN